MTRHRATTITLLAGLLLAGGCGVTLQPDPEPLEASTEAPAPAPTVSVRPDAADGLPEPIAPIRPTPGAPAP
ncbi:hypothetical protein WIS52_10485 [Pseudonocardia nematodicida]|uniref:Uncharacterized protein n=1 Tax=Pseudonocardia nematodicida TaxID=1206997 RepID=A0ABV1K8U5_9PSEU